MFRLVLVGQQGSPTNKRLAAQDGENLIKGWEAGKGDLAEQFLAGVVAHLHALQAFTVPTVLGYERLKPGKVPAFPCRPGPHS